MTAAITQHRRLTEGTKTIQSHCTVHNTVATTTTQRRQKMIITIIYCS